MRQLERTSCAPGRQMRLAVLQQAKDSWEYPAVADENALEDILLCTVHGKESNDCSASSRGNALEAVFCSAVGFKDRVIFRAADPAALDPHTFFFLHWHYSPLWALACRTMFFHFLLQVTKFDLRLP